MAHRPKILIPASFNADQPPAKYHFNVAYTTRIVNAGGLPLGIMRPDEDDIDEMLSMVDGIFLMGGNDIHPKEYNEEDHACILTEKERDRVEFMLVKKAIALRIPILGICRGFQVMNVAMGGSLYQDVATQVPGALRHSNHKDENGVVLPLDMIAHSVSIAKESKLYRLAGGEVVNVNSLHHQGIKKLGIGLRATATAPDGLIEAVEIEDHPFGLGVEWHPEELHDVLSQNIFSAFIEATRR